MSRKLVVGQIALSFHIAAAAVVTNLLEEAGVQVELRTAPHEKTFALLARSEIDLVVSAWLPHSHGAYIAPFEHNLVKLAKIYEPYCIWGIPDYAPEHIRSISDLANPEVANLFCKLIQGIGPGAGISRFSREIVSEYALDEHGFHFENGSLAECTTAFEKALAARELAVVPLWHPQWLNDAHEIRELKDPKGLLRGADEATLVLHSRAAEKLPPEALCLLSRVHLGNAVVSGLDRRICQDGLSPAEAADEWISTNRSLCDGWLKKPTV